MQDAPKACGEVKENDFPRDAPMIAKLFLRNALRIVAGNRLSAPRASRLTTPAALVILFHEA